MLDPGFARPEGPAPDLQLAAFAARTIALSVILGLVYNRTRGSVWVCMLAHWTASLTYPGAGTAGALPAQALVFGVLAVALGMALRSELRPGNLERRVTRDGTRVTAGAAIITRPSGVLVISAGDRAKLEADPASHKKRRRPFGRRQRA